MTNCSASSLIGDFCAKPGLDPLPPILDEEDLWTTHSA